MTLYLGYMSLAYAWRQRATILQGHSGDLMTGDVAIGLRAHALRTMHGWLDLAAHAKLAFNTQIEGIITNDLQ